MVRGHHRPDRDEGAVLRRRVEGADDQGRGNPRGERERAASGGENCSKRSPCSTTPSWRRIYRPTTFRPIRSHRLLRVATLARTIAADFLRGVARLHRRAAALDAVVRYLPSPLDRPPVEGEHPNPKKRDKVHESRKCSPNEPFCGLVFKIVADQHADLYFVRVYSGVSKSGSRAAQSADSTRKS